MPAGLGVPDGEVSRREIVKDPTPEHVEILGVRLVRRPEVLPHEFSKPLADAAGSASVTGEQGVKDAARYRRGSYLVLVPVRCQGIYSRDHAHEREEGRIVLLQHYRDALVEDLPKQSDRPLDIGVHVSSGSAPEAP